MKHLGNTALRTPVEAGWNERLLQAQRRKLFDAFLEFSAPAPHGSVLDLGLRAHGMPAVPPPWGGSDSSRVAAYALDPTLPGLRLPYPDQSFDWVYCAELIEHAGSRAHQQRLLDECYRCARRGVFLCCANRRHPIEFNTGLPLMHWLPRGWRQRLLQWSGQSRWAGLALLDAPTLYQLAAALPGKPEHDVGHKRVFGIKAHFFLMVRRRG